ncbi:MAG TPA: TetR/AcrR family transcriptional regulator [Gemmataceae bacterium]|nr:TetR/AcrR family transcriptional regulator [Gemmataceae bacterium]
MKHTIEKKPRRPVDPALGERRREQILEAAAKLFAKHGYAAADTQLLAEELGVGKGTIYRYFPSKEEVFLAAADRGMHMLCEQVDSSIQGIDDPLHRIAVAIRSYLAFFAEHPEFVELLMQERAQFKDRKKPTFFVHREARVEQWRTIYRRLIAEGRVREMPVERITNVMSDLVYGTMFTNYFTGQRKPFESQAQDILDVVFHGILSDAERRQQRDEDTKTCPRSSED